MNVEDNMNDEERQNMRFNDAFTRQNKRIDPDIKKKEKYLKYMNDDNNLKIYFKDINDTLVNICNSCEQIWFFSSVKYYQVQSFLDKYIRPNDKNRQIQFLIDYCNLSND
jgi:frataxin-like iron-binding protein CyaY